MDISEWLKNESGAWPYIGPKLLEAAREIDQLRFEHRALFDLIKDDALLVERFNAAVERRQKRHG